MNNIERLFEKLTPIRILLLCRSLWLIVAWLFARFDWASGYFVVLICGTFFHALSLGTIWKNRRPASSILVVQIVFDLVLMTILLALSGGATNAFVTALLIPVVFACVSLSLLYAIGMTVASMVAYSVLVLNSVLVLKLPHSTTHQMDMTDHYLGMWFNFILSGIIIAFTVSLMAKMIAKREQHISAQREHQLRQEQVLAISIASAQVTHDIATPLATVQLLYEELQEQYPDDALVKSGQQSLALCAHHLDNFRGQIATIREGDAHWLSVEALLDKLQDAALLYFPDQQLHLTAEPHLGEVWVDEMLLPALVNLLHNAVLANQDSDRNLIELRSHIERADWVLELRDFGQGLNAQALEEVGAELVNSKEGFGIAALLSNMTIERLGGSLALENHSDLGCVTRVRLKHRGTV